MSDKKKQQTNKLKPRHIIRCGEISASIYLRQANSGHVYFDYVIDREWTSLRTSKTLKGSSLFAANETDAIECIRKASEWIRSQADHPPLLQKETNE